MRTIRLAAGALVGMALLVTAAAVSVRPSLAAEVSEDRALQVAVNQMNEAVLATSKVARPALDKNAVIRTFTRRVEDVTVSYVFNFRSSGWVIVTADDIATPILAYSTEGSYAEENHPPAFDDWIGGAERVIRRAVADRVSATDGTVEAWKRLEQPTDRFLDDARDRLEARAATGQPGVFGPTVTRQPQTLGPTFPLLDTTWGQGGWIPVIYDFAWNRYCPCVTKTWPDICWERAPTGCVATAMGQIMKYWSWPPEGTGSHCYTDDNEGEQCADFGNSSYNWGLMFPWTSTWEAAKLLRHCGVSVNMDYEKGGSGATSPAAAQAFSKYFQYDCTKLIERSDYTSDSEWLAMLWIELTQGHPLYYAADEPGAAVGHAFVCDGITWDDSLHINWGWDLEKAYLNGWYTLDLKITDWLGPDYHFSEDHEAIVGIHKYLPPTVDAGPDVTIAGVDQDGTVICGTVSDDDDWYPPDDRGAVQFRWLSGNTPLSSWAWNATDGAACLDLARAPSFGNGRHELKLQAKDCVKTLSDVMTLTIDAPPVAVCPPDATIECQGNEAATSRLDGSGSYDPEGNTLSYRWTSATCTLDPATAARTDASCPLGPNSVRLVVNDGRLDSEPCTMDCAVVDTKPPEGRVTFPPAGACLRAPVTIVDDCTDLCSDALARTYLPGPGPTYLADGAYSVVVTVEDPSANPAELVASFIIDNLAPAVTLAMPQTRPGLLRSVPLANYFTTSDADAAPGEVLHERIYIDGCPVFDGMAYGDGDGLLHDEAIAISPAMMCRTYEMCGQSEFADSVLRIEADDCAANTGFAEAVIEGHHIVNTSMCRGVRQGASGPSRVERRAKGQF